MVAQHPFRLASCTRGKKDISRICWRQDRQRSIYRRLVHEKLPCALRDDEVAPGVSGCIKGRDRGESLPQSVTFILSQLIIYREHRARLCLLQQQVLALDW